MKNNSISKKYQRNILRIFCIMLSVIFCIFSLTFYSKADNKSINSIDKSNATMQVHFIDVGQSNCTLIQSKDYNMLIDAGDNLSGNKIVNYLNNLGITKLNYVIATHAHEDHIGSMYDIINNFKIDTFFLPRKTHNTSTYLEMLEALDANNISITSPIYLKSYPLGYGEFTIISPIIDSNELSINNSSITVRITDSNNSFIIGGDMEKKQELSLVNQNIDLSADVLLLNHHGSNTSNSLKFLQEVNPSMAIISVGNGKQYNMPNKEVINRLNSLNIPYYSTYENGTIIATSDGNSIEYTVSKNEKHQEY